MANTVLKRERKEKKKRRDTSKENNIVFREERQGRENWRKVRREEANAVMKGDNERMKIRKMGKYEYLMQTEEGKTEKMEKGKRREGSNAAL